MGSTFNLKIFLAAGILPTMEAIRYDRTEIKATRTDEGYLIDTPIVGRVGIQLYKNADVLRSRYGNNCVL